MRQGDPAPWRGIGGLCHLILSACNHGCQWLAGRPQARDYCPDSNRRPRDESGAKQTRDETPPPAKGIRAAKGETMSAPMKFIRREFLQLAAGAAALPALSGFVLAQTDPSRAVRLVVPFPPGGSVDQISRMVQAG